MNIAVELLKSLSRFSERTAISDGLNSLTYKTLHQKSIKVAAYLQQYKLVNVCVAIDIDSAADHIIAMIGIVISGNYYISITNENRWLIDENILIPLTLSSTGCASDIICFNDIFKQNDLPASYFSPQIDDHNTMCAFFTSGSTGAAKIVLHSHKNILNDTLRQIKDNNISPTDKLDLVFSLSFSASLACIYPALLTGAELCVFNLKEEGLTGLANFWRQKNISFSTLSVTSFHGICKSLPSLHHLTSLRFISISAEPVKETTIYLFRSTFGANVVLQIAYASTETRTITEMKVYNNGTPTIYPDAIGKPVTGKTVHIANTEGNYLPVGAVGEIIVESAYIANAYYGRADESNLSFLIKGDTVFYKTGDLGYINEDGYLFYMGRINGENKFNGIKINLAQIEQQTEKTSGVLQAAIIINKFDPVLPRLVCFFEPDNTTPVTATSIKDFISESLPPSHLPQFYIQLPKLPVTHSGKTDRKKLEVFDIKECFFKTAPSSVENHSEDYGKIIANIFKEVLQVENIERTTDFFDAGGDSMSALICIAEIESKLNLKLSSIALIANPTAQKLSEYLIQQKNNLSLIEKIEINGYDNGKRNLYFLNTGRNECYKNFYESSLSAHFNLIEVYYDIYGSNDASDYAEIVVNELADEIANYANSIVVGYSFNGYVAHQLACKVTQITHCVLIDTIDYFEYAKYVKLQNTITAIRSVFWHIFHNKDFGYPAYAVRRLLAKCLVKIKDTENDQQQSDLFIKQVNYFTSQLQYKSTFHNCIYFQATRNYKNLGRSWQTKVGGDFYYKSLNCNHLEIITKANDMADFIIEIKVSR
jgi:acyl-coenzyme A synthetase/AMP-(fatty) acid ligase/acyl carrier protein